MLIQTRIEVGHITFHRRRPIRGQYMYSLCQYKKHCIYLYFQLVWVIQPLIFVKLLCSLVKYKKVGMLTQTSR